MGLFWSRKNDEDKKATVNITNVQPKAIMGWRYVTYIEGNNAVSFNIEPMVNCPDIISIPDKLTWHDVAPDWAIDKREAIIQFLKSIKWNRELEWNESNYKNYLNELNEIIPGTIESTQGGSELEAARLFHPRTDLTPQQAHTVWETAERHYAEQMNGQIDLFIEPVIENSVVNKITIPTLKNNPNAKLIFHKNEAAL